MKAWNGRNLVGPWTFTWKVDGVQVIVTRRGQTVSRNNKPLYNLKQLKLNPGTYEIYCGSWEASITATRTVKGKPVLKKCVYALDPTVDKRLLISKYRAQSIRFNPTADLIKEWLQHALSRGYEGLVLRQGDTRLKVKPKQTYDVKVTGVLYGKGKHTGKIGALVTKKGKVGTGLTDVQRVEFARVEKPTDKFPIVGKVIEVESMGLTPNGKFRHPRFIRERFDK